MSAAIVLTECAGVCGDHYHYDPEDIEAGLRGSRAELEDLADRIEESCEAVGKCSKSDLVLIWMTLKIVLLRLG